jgi:phage repressor protein C with HTH and peptisase S24 domain
MVEPHERLRRARVAAGYKNASVAAVAIGVNRATYLGHENGSRAILSKQATLYGEKFGVSPGWIMLGEGEPPVRELIYVPLDEGTGEPIEPDQFGVGYDREHYKPEIPGAIPELDVKAGAGEGAVGEILVIPMGAGTIAAHKVIGEWAIPEAFLREAVKNPERAIVLPIEGDSMLPNYAPGDRVVVDLSETELRADGVYLITDGYSPPQVKRLQRLMFTVPQMVAIVSDNPAYAKIETDIASVKVLGKISAYVGRR